MAPIWKPLVALFAFSDLVASQLLTVGTNVFQLQADSGIADVLSLSLGLGSPQICLQACITANGANVRASTFTPNTVVPSLNACSCKTGILGTVLSLVPLIGSTSYTYFCDLTTSILVTNVCTACTAGTLPNAGGTACTSPLTLASLPSTTTNNSPFPISYTLSGAAAAVTAKLTKGATTINLGTSSSGTIAATVPGSTVPGLYTLQLNSGLYTASAPLTVTANAIYVEDANNCGYSSNVCSTVVGGTRSCSAGVCGISCTEGFIFQTPLLCIAPFSLTSPPTSIAAGASISIPYTASNLALPVSLQLKGTESNTLSQTIGTSTTGSISATIPSNAPVGAYNLVLSQGTNPYLVTVGLTVTQNPAFVNDPSNCGVAGVICSVTSGGSPACTDSSCDITCDTEFIRVSNLVCIAPLAFTSPPTAAAAGTRISVPFTANNLAAAVQLSLRGPGVDTTVTPLQSSLTSPISAFIPQGLGSGSYDMVLSQTPLSFQALAPITIGASPNLASITVNGKVYNLVTDAAVNVATLQTITGQTSAADCLNACVGITSAVITSASLDVLTGQCACKTTTGGEPSPLLGILSYVIACDLSVAIIDGTGTCFICLAGTIPNLAGTECVTNLVINIAPTTLANADPITVTYTLTGAPAEVTLALVGTGTSTFDRTLGASTLSSISSTIPADTPPGAYNLELSTATGSSAEQAITITIATAFENDPVNCGYETNACPSTVANASPSCTDGVCGFACNGGLVPNAANSACINALSITASTASTTNGGGVSVSYQLLGTPALVTLQLVNSAGVVVGNPLGSSGDGSTIEGTVPGTSPVGTYTLRLTTAAGGLAEAALQVTLNPIYGGDVFNCGFATNICPGITDGDTSCTAGICVFTCPNGSRLNAQSTACIAAVLSFNGVIPATPSGGSVNVAFTLTGDPATVSLELITTNGQTSLASLGESTDLSPITATIPATTAPGFYALRISTAAGASDMTAIQVTLNPTYATDPLNCGFAGNLCPTIDQGAASCNAGVCGATCPTGSLIDPQNPNACISATLSINGPIPNTQNGAPLSVGYTLDGPVQVVTLSLYDQAGTTSIAALGTSSSGNIDTTVPATTPVGTYTLQVSTAGGNTDTAPLVVTLNPLYAGNIDSCGFLDNSCPLISNGNPTCENGICGVGCPTGFEPNGDNTVCVAITATLVINGPIAATNNGDPVTVPFTLTGPPTTVTLSLLGSDGTTVIASAIGTSTDGASVTGTIPATTPVGNYVVQISIPADVTANAAISVTLNPLYAEDVDNCGFQGNDCPLITSGSSTCTNGICGVQCPPGQQPNLANTACVAASLTINGPIPNTNNGDPVTVPFTLTGPITTVTLDLLGGTSVVATLGTSTDGTPITGTVPATTPIGDYTIRVSTAGGASDSAAITVTLNPDFAEDINSCGYQGNACPLIDNGGPTCLNGICGLVCSTNFELNQDNTACIAIVATLAIDGPIPATNNGEDVTVPFTLTGAIQAVTLDLLGADGTTPVASAIGTSVDGISVTGTIPATTPVGDYIVKVSAADGTSDTASLSVTLNPLFATDPESCGFQGNDCPLITSGSSTCTDGICGVQCPPGQQPNLANTACVAASLTINGPIPNTNNGDPVTISYTLTGPVATVTFDLLDGTTLVATLGTSIDGTPITGTIPATLPIGDYTVRVSAPDGASDTAAITVTLNSAYAIDPLSCGYLGNACPGIIGGSATCTNGICGLSCPPGQQVNSDSTVCIASALTFTAPIPTSANNGDPVTASYTLSGTAATVSMNLLAADGTVFAPLGSSSDGSPISGTIPATTPVGTYTLQITTGLGGDTATTAFQVTLNPLFAQDPDNCGRAGQICGALRGDAACDAGICSITCFANTVRVDQSTCTPPRTFATIPTSVAQGAGFQVTYTALNSTFINDVTLTLSGTDGNTFTRNLGVFTGVSIDSNIPNDAPVGTYTMALSRDGISTVSAEFEVTLAASALGRRRGRSLRVSRAFRKTPLCASSNETACFSSSGSFECLDTLYELTSCGGCVSEGKGEDCTAIPNAFGVQCDMGSCVVTSCQPGYRQVGNKCIRATFRRKIAK